MRSAESRATRGGVRARRAGPGRLLAFAVAAALTSAACHEPAPPLGGPLTHVVTIRGRRIAVELADTLEKKARGLGDRDALAPRTGMLFPYAMPGVHAFWMAGMRFDLDLVWIRDGRIVDITARVPHPPPEASRGPGLPPLPVYSPREPADLVLEVTAGTAEQLGWRIGDPVRVDPPLH